MKLTKEQKSQLRDKLHDIFYELDNSPIGAAITIAYSKKINPRNPANDLIKEHGYYMGSWNYQYCNSKSEFKTSSHLSQIIHLAKDIIVDILEDLKAEIKETFDNVYIKRALRKINNLQMEFKEIAEDSKNNNVVQEINKIQQTQLEMKSQIQSIFESVLGLIGSQQQQNQEQNKQFAALNQKLDDLTAAHVEFQVKLNELKPNNSNNNNKTTKSTHSFLKFGSK